MAKLVEDVGRGIEDKNAGGRYQHDRQPGSGQDQAHRVAGAGMGLTDDKHGDPCQPCADKGEPHIGQWRHQIERGRPYDDCQCSTCIDTQQARLGQRVARDRLHDRSGHPQRQPGQDRHQGARDTQLAHYQVDVVLPIIGTQRIKDLVQAQGA